jgi:replication factor C subunit 1
MDIRSFFAKKSPEGASTKPKVGTADTAVNVKRTTKRAKEEEDTTKKTMGFETFEDEDDTQPIRPSPKKKPKQQVEKSPTTPMAVEKAANSSTKHSATKRLGEPSTPAATKTPTATRSPKKAKATPTPQRMTLLEPTERDNYDLKTDNIVPECLQGLTFCLTGVLEELHRDDATDLLKSLGAKVTNAVSGKTSYLIVGTVLEDGRPPEEGRKYKDALEKGTRIITSAKQLYGLCHQYQDQAMKLAGATKASTPNVSHVKANPYASKAAANPYAKKTLAGSTAAATGAANPYARKANPYDKAGGPAPSPAVASNNNVVASSLSSSKPGQLWVDRHAPTSTREILGNADNVGKLKAWLNSWERTFNKPEAYGKSFSAPKGPWKAALLSGPPGIGSK